MTLTRRQFLSLLPLALAGCTPVALAAEPIVTGSPAMDSPTPTPLATGTAVPQLCTVQVDQVNVRSKPSKSGRWLGSLAKGDEVPVFQQVENGWALVEYEPRRYGYIYLCR